MTRSPLWREFESGDSFLLRAIRFCILVGGVFFLLFTGILELTWPQQAVLGLLTVLVAMWMDRSSTSYLITLTLMLVSMYSTFRYGFWRISTTIRDQLARTGCVLHLAAGAGGVVRVRNFVPGLFADALAAAQDAGAAA
jgi:hypothetical protein